MSQVGRSHARDSARTSSLVRPASSRGVTAPRSAAARMPGRKPATASSALVPVATCARPCSAASGPSTSSSSALQWKQRSPAFARYPSRSISRVRGASQRTPRPVAKARASSRSPPASEAETAVAAATCSGPSTRTAAASTNAESAPPENATSTDPRSRRRASSASTRSGGHAPWVRRTRTSAAVTSAELTPRGYVRAPPPRAAPVRTAHRGAPVHTVTSRLLVGPTGRIRTIARQDGDPPAARGVGTSTSDVDRPFRANP